MPLPKLRPPRIQALSPVDCPLLLLPFVEPRSGQLGRAGGRIVDNHRIVFAFQKGVLRGGPVMPAKGYELAGNRIEVALAGLNVVGSTRHHGRDDILRLVNIPAAVLAQVDDDIPEPLEHRQTGVIKIAVHLAIGPRLKGINGQEAGGIGQRVYRNG